MEAVEGKAEVYIDGGIRTGTDVLKALALGARAVFIGRPAVWGLATKVLVTVYILHSPSLFTQGYKGRPIYQVLRVCMTHACKSKISVLHIGPNSHT